MNSIYFGTDPSVNIFQTAHRHVGFANPRILTIAFALITFIAVSNVSNEYIISCGDWVFRFTIFIKLDTV